MLVLFFYDISECPVVVEEVVVGEGYDDADCYGIYVPDS